jgi:hypothetical protein
LCEGQGLYEKQVSIEIERVLKKFATAFEIPKQLPPLRDVDHAIPLLPNSNPVNLRHYRYSHFQKIELEKLIEELLRSFVIRPSNSPFASSALLVKKKDDIDAYVSIIDNWMQWLSRTNTLFLL